MNNWFDIKFDEVKKWRRDLHRMPQPGWAEFFATGYVAGRLERWGYSLIFGKDLHSDTRRYKLPDDATLETEYQAALAAGIDEKYIAPGKGGYTGVIGELRGAQPGPVVVYRFDIDALALEESADVAHIPAREGFASVNGRYMHACGHDGHTAYGLLLALWFVEHREHIKGTVRLIFQPAEEGGVGGGTMTEAGAVDDADYFVCGHIGIIPAQRNIIVTDPQGFYAVKRYEVTYSGRAAHAANNPQDGCNALLAACAAVQNIYAISRHSSGATRVNVGRFVAANEWNIIPDKASFAVELRGTTDEAAGYMSARALSIIKAAAQMYDAECEIHREAALHSSRNSAEFVQMATTVAIECAGAENTRQSGVFGASEDATCFMERVKERGGQALFVVFATPVAGGHHNSSFDFDEAVLKLAAEYFSMLYLKIVSQSENRVA